MAQNPLVRGAVLVLVTIAIFIPAMSGEFIWDDDITLTNNPLVKLPFSQGFRDIWISPHATDYYPLTWSTFWVEWRFFGLNLTGYQAINVVLHALSAVLLWRILERLGLPGGPATAWCAALLFAVHPVAVDSVAWISQRKNTLSMIFYLLSILGFLKFDDAEGRRFYWLSALAFMAALLSKTSIIALPMVLVVLLWYRHGDSFLTASRAQAHPAPPKKRQFSVFRHKLIQFVPFFGLAAAAAFVTIWFQGKAIGFGMNSGYDPGDTVSQALTVSFEGSENSPALRERLLLTGQVYWFYLCKLFFPARVAMVYATWTINARNWLHYLPVLSMAGAIGITFYYRKKIGRGPCAALAYLLFALLPVLGLVRMSYHSYSWVANHLAYVAIPGITALGTGVAARLLRRLPSPGSRIAPLLALLIVFAIFATATWRRATLYINPEDLWKDNIAKIPTAYAAYNELGIVYIVQKRYEEAVPLFEQCIAIRPSFTKPHNNLGTALSYLSRNEESIAALERALRFNANDPDSLGNLGLMYLRTGRPEKAIEALERTLEIRPLSPATHHNLGLALVTVGRKEDATGEFARAIALDPTTESYHRVLGKHYYDLRDYRLALQYSINAIHLGSRDHGPYNLAAWIMATNDDPSLRNGAEALRYVSMAEQLLKEKNPGLLATKAAALAEIGRFEEAVSAIQAAVSLATESGNTALLERFKRDLQLYSSGQPFREGKTSAPANPGSPR